DSKVPVIWAYDYDTATGAISGRRIVARPTEEVGRPDGAATDEDGFYWSADGRLDRSIPLPCSNPTAPCFGGPDMKTIYVTSLRHGVRAEVLAEKPLSGGIFAVQVDVPGVPIGRFRG